jgi:hypothetical protein
MRKLVCPPGLETIGINLSAFYDNLQGENTKPVMEKHGVMNIDPQKWYPAQKLLDALNELSDMPDFMGNMVAIGKKIGEITPIPPEISEKPTLPQVLNIWDGLYQYLHRNGDAGQIVIEKVSDSHYRTGHSVLYPDDLSYGVAYAFARRFLPPKTGFKVYYDTEHPIRDYGGAGEFSYIHIKWD